MVRHVMPWATAAVYSRSSASIETADVHCKEKQCFRASKALF